MKAPKFCPECGTKTEDSWKHCASCGISFTGGNSETLSEVFWESGLPGIYTQAQRDGGAVDDIEEVTSDMQLRGLVEHNEYSGWVNLGRPRYLIVNGYPMPEMQYKFAKKYGYPMPEDIVELWAHRGQPDIDSWNIEADFEAFQDEKAKANKKAQKLLFWGQVIGGLAGGANDTLRSVTNTRPSEPIKAYVDPVPRTVINCTRCGSPKPGAVCPYCQV